MTLDLRHYSDRAVRLDRARTYTQRVGVKPSGLWVSVPGDDDWPTWCRDVDFGLAHLAVEHAVTLRSDARILHVTTLDALHAITVHVPWTGSRGSTWIDHHVDWPDLAERYDGIVIAPYQWKARLDHDVFWYYGEPSQRDQKPQPGSNDSPTRHRPASRHLFDADAVRVGLRVGVHLEP